MPSKSTKSLPHWQAQAIARRNIRQQDLEKKTAKKRKALTLRKFVDKAWPILEPNTPFVPNWHIDDGCRHLEAVTYGQIHKIVFMWTPGYMKSLLINVFWPAWEWAEVAASTRWLFSSYNEEFVERDSAKMRDLIRSEWYQSEYGKHFRIRRGKDTALEYHNDKTGFRVAVGVGGGTGQRAHRIVTDDPHKIEEIESDTARNKVIHWWRNTMSQRNVDPENVSHIIIMQALHVDDLAHHAIKHLDYQVMRLPNEYEPDEPGETSIWKDPRTTKGELAWPARFGPDATAEAKMTLGPRGYASQFQQRPYPAGGNIIKRVWFKVVKQLPEGYDAVRAWDMAGTDEAPGKEPAYTAGGLLVRCRETKRFCIADMRRFRASAGVVEKTIGNVASQDGLATRIVLEQEPGSAGKAVIHHYETQVLNGYAVEAVRPTGAKRTRLLPFAAQAEAGRIDILEGEWNDACLTELEQAPNGKFMDQADALAHAFNSLADHQESVTEMMYRIRRQNPR